MTDADIPIRPARPTELPTLAGIELRAAARFPETDLPPALRGKTLPAETLALALREGMLWVADNSGQPVGFALAEMLDGQLHLAEMDVDPDHARRGIGAALLRQVLAEAARRGFAAVTLTTFSHLPWNEPFYRRHGFEQHRPAAGSQLAARLAAESEAGLQRRIAMRRALRPAG